MMNKTTCIDLIVHNHLHATLYISIHSCFHFSVISKYFHFNFISLVFHLMFSWVFGIRSTKSTLFTSIAIAGMSTIYMCEILHSAICNDEPRLVKVAALNVVAKWVTCTCNKFCEMGLICEMGLTWSYYFTSGPSYKDLLENLFSTTPVFISRLLVFISVTSVSCIRHYFSLGVD